MNTLPKEPAEQSAQRVVATFFVEYLPGVKNDYDLLRKAAGGEPQISLPDLQMGTLIFALHCLDRAVLALWGAEFRAVFMDYAFGMACDGFAEVLPDDLREAFLEHFDKECRSRQREYSAMTLLPTDNGSLKGVLCWEYAKRICLDSGVENPLVLKATLDGAVAIFTMMQRIASTL